MIEIAVKNIEKYYGANHILKGINFVVNQGQHIGLLGKNGSGKTTLLKLLSGGEKPDNGDIMIRKGVTIGMLDQLPQFPLEYSVYQVLTSAFEAIFEVRLQMADIELQMTKEPCSHGILEKYGRLQQKLETLDGYAVEENISRVCNGLKITEELLLKPFSVLSGGEKTRIALGRMILQNPDILLMDEPSNHLDLSSIEWLEEYLKSYPGTVILISHDRYFLDSVVSGIVEIVDGKAEIYLGNYTAFAKEKEERLTRQLEKYEQEQKKIKQLEAAAKRIHEWANNANNAKLHRSAFNIEKRIERMEKTDRPRNEKKMSYMFNEESFSGQEVITIKDLVKAFGERKVLNGTDLMVYKSERVAILGNNGSGKSTIFKTLIGECTADEGSVKIGNSINYAYLPQVVLFEDSSLSLLDTVRVILQINEEKARSLLARYKFRSDEVCKVVDNLSGGEKSRLKLCLLMQENVNLLLLDEPTNHLDISSREWLEAALEEFEGTLVFISHDRYFINKFATRVSELENGKITNYCGNYEYYKLSKSNDTANFYEKSRQPKNVNAGSTTKVFPKPTNPKKTAKEVELAITELEEVKRTLDKEMQQYSDNYSELQVLYQQQKELDKQIEELYGEWTMI